MRRALFCTALATGLMAAASPTAAQRIHPFVPQVPLVSVGGFGGIVAGDSDVRLFGVQADLPVANYMSFTGELAGFVANVTCEADPNATCDGSGVYVAGGPRMWFLNQGSIVAPYIMGMAGFGLGGETWSFGIVAMGAAGAEVRLGPHLGLWGDGQVRWLLDDDTGADYGMSVGLRYKLAR